MIIFLNGITQGRHQSQVRINPWTMFFNGVRAEWHFLKAEELIKFQVSSITASLIRSCDTEPTGFHLQGGLS